MEIEINFRLDEHGRTADPKASNGNDNPCDGPSNLSSASSSGPIQYGQQDNRPQVVSLDYEPKVTMTNLRPSSSFVTEHSVHRQFLDDLLFDCEISDCGLMPRTFWVPARGMKPRFTLEQFALDVFHHHVPKELQYDQDSSGAEWWCQLRPSPEGTGRYSMHCPSKDDEEDGDDQDDDDNDPFAQGISMHVDKDEELRILTGGTTYIHPHLSTVTYLTDFGSPTIILDCRVQPLTGEWIVPDEIVHGFVSWPALGKHTSFDGRFLHASPTDVMEDGAFDKQIQFSPRLEDEQWNKVQRRRHRRVTFLVNIWLNYRPFDVNPYPETMVDKMSGRDEATRQKLEFIPTSLSASPVDALRIRNTSVHAGEAIELASIAAVDSNNEIADMSGRRVMSSYSTELFTWALGDKKSGEKLALHVPLQSIRKEAARGGNTTIEWHRLTSATGGKEDSDCFRMSNTNRQTTIQNNGDASRKRPADELSTDPADDATGKHHAVD